MGHPVIAGVHQASPHPPALAIGGMDRVTGAWVSSVSCPAAWTCATVGSYTDTSGNTQPFLLGSL